MTDLIARLRPLLIDVASDEDCLCDGGAMCRKCVTEALITDLGRVDSAADTWVLIIGTPNPEAYGGPRITTHLGRVECATELATWITEELDALGEREQPAGDRQASVIDGIRTALDAGLVGLAAGIFEAAARGGILPTFTWQAYQADHGYATPEDLTLPDPRGVS